MFCTSCGMQAAEGGVFCTGCGKPVAGPAATRSQQYSFAAEIPEGVKGWSWGAFLLSWIWAIGNRTWVGLLALVPYAGLVVALWLGFKGREMAWKNGEWDSVEHFDRVQKTWSRWGVGIVFGIMIIGILSAIALPAYQDYTRRAKERAPESAMRAVPVPQLAAADASTATIIR